ncbi:MAG: hypothetical protein H6853_07965 [Rhodospirillales bacterium]|nr:hypothetical protein [Alphaproteobacteria bacterium]USO03449.1 MAG: hypothetical protein H6853_07965 [Rhodospirillales bacterium]
MEISEKSSDEGVKYARKHFLHGTKIKDRQESFQLFLSSLPCDGSSADKRGKALAELFETATKKCNTGTAAALRTLGREFPSLRRS